ncbi:helix-turn-helix domain-containing protein [Kitasatospora sp. NPDC058218]|uniref:helix-turn-helix domain-containing protein n=1 Tax=Kitasatospora sp. NPDC058218 TaxID=3346385 RepID=UPI0036DE2BBF
MTIASAHDRVVCGELDEGSTYRTVRSGGTTDWVLFVTLAGRGRFRLPGHPDLLAGPDRITAVEPGTPHDYGTDHEASGWSLRWAHLNPRPDWLSLLDWPTAAPGIRQVEVDDTVRARVVQALDRAISARRAGLRRSTLFAMNAVEEALLWCDTRNPGGTVLDPRLLTVLEHIGDTIEEPHSVDSLARIGGLSPSRLAHLASAQLGTGLMSYVDRQRMDLARQLLMVTDLPVATIAARIGFTDPLYFSRRFRVATSLSPTAFRLRERGRTEERQAEGRSPCTGS